MCNVDKMYWGYHMILDCGRCIPSSIRNPKTIYKFSKTLVKKIDMVPFGEPQVQHFGSGNKAGYTLVQLIETSNICAHFVEETNDMYLDVFSCKEFDQEIVKAIVNETFSPQLMTHHFIHRKAPNTVIKNGTDLRTPELK